MSLIKCKECEKEISSKADSCPHCGNQIKPKPTGCRSVVLTLLAGLILFIIVVSNMSPSKIKIHSLDLSRSDDYERLSLIFKNAANKVMSLNTCTKGDMEREGFTKSTNYNSYFVNCTDNLSVHGVKQYHVKIESGDNIYLKKDGRLHKFVNW